MKSKTGEIQQKKSDKRLCPPPFTDKHPAQKNKAGVCEAQTPANLLAR
ncbi:hypothetical protein HC231_03295 [Brenneria izadpanahii]|uniref:Uncharacterized protein n=1 Tax=Brenneria izadpanahii TaxID=2722756 RepID=A0ABX7UP90_9GAMM|nr:hypothetical protein [Brenneria izadpanahii]QTF07065.1 hypothetical protein HC231_03295 [Brenneria izadpanahii]